MNNSGFEEFYTRLCALKKWFHRFLTIYRVNEFLDTVQLVQTSILPVKMNNSAFVG